jgi:Domain of Unknown Function (DUF1080)
MNRARGIATAFVCASLGLAGALTGTLGQAQAQGEGKDKGKAQEQFELLPGMTMLANGKSLEPFEQAGTANWRIAEQAMAADYGQGFLVTKQSYADFQLHLEFWSDEGTNSGVFIRCADPEAPGAQSCYEINIFDDNPNRANATGSVVGVAAPLKVPQTELKWNILDIEAKGPRINVSVNNERTVSVRDTKHARGRIALQRNAGVIYFRNVQIRALTPEDIANETESLYAQCDAGFGIIWPGGEPQGVRDADYTLANGQRMQAKEYYLERDGGRFSVKSIDFPNGPYSDRDIVNHAVAEILKKGRPTFVNYVTVGLGRPGGQISVVQPNGRAIRAAVYMGGKKLIIAEADAPAGDSNAVLFEQSIVLVNRAGNDLDRVNPNNAGLTRKYDCR